MALPKPSAGRIPFGLCVYGLTIHTGLERAADGSVHSPALTPEQLVRLAADDGFSHLELDLRLVGGYSPAALRRLRVAADQHRLRILTSAGPVESLEEGRELRIAAELGAPTVRVLLSRVLCGERNEVRGGWQAHLDRCRATLERLVPAAERAGICLAIENHQDVTSLELLALCRWFDSPALGVTLDTGNPLAVMEEPLEFADRIGPYLRHVHFKDYRIYPAPDGWRLVRCALGEGVVPLGEIAARAGGLSQTVTLSQEMAALKARTIRFRAPGWWDGFPGRSAPEAIAALEHYFAAIRPSHEDYHTPWERGARVPALLQYELEQHRASRAFLDRLAPGPCPAERMPQQ